MSIKEKLGNSFGDYMTIFGYILIILIFGGPILWLVSLSFRTPQQLFSYPPKIFPDPISLDGYKQIFFGKEVFIFLRNSLKISLLSSFGTLLVTVPAAYGLSRFRFKNKGLLLIIILLFQMISPLIVVIPLYRYFGKINLLNSHFGTILVYIAILIPLITWMLKGFFDSIPISLEEAAKIDGCSRFRALVKIILPISSTGLFSAFIFTFLLSWAQFIIPLILLDNGSLLPISVGIYVFQAARSSVTTHLIAGVSLLTIVPPLIVFVLLQKYVVKVLTAGAVKG